jgi:predicted AAA+ superfamily ATPase
MANAAMLLTSAAAALAVTWAMLAADRGRRAARQFVKSHPAKPAKPQSDLC